MLVGDVIMSARAADYVDADGSVMLLCDGRVVAAGAYPVLVALVGASFGVLGQIPQLGLNGAITGYCPIGASPAGGYAMGANGGQENHAHTNAACPAFAHRFPAGSSTGPAAAPSAEYLAGAQAAAAAGHSHDVPMVIGDHAVIPDPENTAWISPVMGTNFFIKAA